MTKETLILLDCYNTDSLGEVRITTIPGKVYNVKNVDCIEVSDEFLHIWHNKVCSCFRLKNLESFDFCHNIVSKEVHDRLR